MMMMMMMMDESSKACPEHAQQVCAVAYPVRGWYIDLCCGTSESKLQGSLSGSVIWHSQHVLAQHSDLLHTFPPFFHIPFRHVLWHKELYMSELFHPCKFSLFRIMNTWLKKRSYLFGPEIRTRESAETASALSTARESSLSGRVASQWLLLLLANVDRLGIIVGSPDPWASRVFRGWGQLGPSLSEGLGRGGSHWWDGQLSRVL